MKITLTNGFALCFALISLNLFAQYPLTLDFEGSDPLAGWTTIGETTDIFNDGGNNVLNVRDTAGAGANTTYYALPTPITTTGSVSFDVFGLNGGGTTNVAFWLNNGTTDANRQVGFGYNPTNSNFEWYSFDGSSGAKFDQVSTFEANTWYNVTMDFDVTANTFQLFVQGGDFTSPTQLTWNSGDDTFAFRNGSATEISHIYITAFSSTNNVNDGIRVDNITVIPEPSSLLLLVSALGACALAWRRR
jgi:hypothetical protein